MPRKGDCHSKLKEGSKMSNATQQDDEPAPLNKLDKAMRGLAGTPRKEADPEAKKERRRKAKSKGMKPKES